MELSKKKFEEVKKNYRKAYPSVDLFFTSDGNCFLKKNMAEAHARREKVKVIEDLINKPEDDKDSEKDPLTEEKAKEILMALTLDDKADYNLLGDIIDALDVEVSGKSKEDRIAVLKPVQKELKGE